MSKKVIGVVASALTALAIISPQAKAADTAPVYVISKSDGATLTVMATSGDTIGGTLLRGTPDGMGMYKNSAGNLTLVSNHEIANYDAVAMKAVDPTKVSVGSSISIMNVDPSTKKVTSVAPLIRAIKWYDYTANSWSDSPANSIPTKPAAGSLDGTNFLSRFCSGHLSEAGDFSYTESSLVSTTKTVNGKQVTTKSTKKTVYGYSDPIYMTGEETSDSSRAFAFDLNGTGIQLPGFGLASWENFLVKPGTGKSTVVMGNEDNGTKSQNVYPNQLYMYLGTKQATGANFAEKAGLTNGKLFTLAVKNALTDTDFRANYPINTKVPAIFNQVNTDPNYANFAKQSLGSGTTFSRIEDGEFDPKNPNVYYFVTTHTNDPASATGNLSRESKDTPGARVDSGGVWRLTFNDAVDPLKGASLELLLTGQELIDMNMPDNIAVDENGYLLLQEDPGNNEVLSRVIAYRISDGKLATLAQFDSQYFTTGKPAFMTKDEETSGIINVNKYFASSGDTKSYMLFNSQVHARPSVARPDLSTGMADSQKTTLDDAVIEGGQYYFMAIDWSKVSFS